MKKILIASCLLLGASLGVSAQNEPAAMPEPAGSQYKNDLNMDPKPDQDRDEYTEKEEVAVSELPEAVQQRITSQDYSGWTLDKAYTKEKDGETCYAVKMKKGNEKKVVKFDAQGNKMKEKNKSKK